MAQWETIRVTCTSTGAGYQVFVFGMASDQLTEAFKKHGMKIEDGENVGEIRFKDFARSWSVLEELGNRGWEPFSTHENPSHLDEYIVWLRKEAREA
jgi:hypothetical protein